MICDSVPTPPTRPSAFAMYFASQMTSTLDMAESVTMLSMNAYLSCPSFRSHLSSRTSMPFSLSRVAKETTKSSCSGDDQLYEMNAAGCCEDVAMVSSKFLRAVLGRSVCIETGAVRDAMYHRRQVGRD